MGMLKGGEKKNMAQNPQEVLKSLIGGNKGNPETQLHLDLGMVLTPTDRKRLIKAVLKELMTILEGDT
jgi:hypothetical protein